MEDKIFEMVIESMKQKLIFSDMVEMRKIIKGAVRMMEAHYKTLINKQDELISKLQSMVDSGQDYDKDYHEIWIELQALKKETLPDDINIDYSREDGK